MLADQEELRQLKEDAKWASSIEGQIKAVGELGALGEVALPSLEEVLQVSVRDEIKQSCIEAIKKLGRDSKPETTKAEKKVSKPKKGRRKAKVSAR